jgi:hypothetical protein
MTLTDLSILKRIASRASACPEHPWVPALAGAITDAKLAHRLKVPLLVTLCFLANAKSGRVLVERRQLADLLTLEEPTVESWLHELEAAGHVVVKSRGSYLVLFLTMWRSSAGSGEAAEAENGASLSGKRSGSTPPSTPPPVPALPLKTTASADSAEQNRAGQGDGVRGPGSEEEGLEGFLDRLVEIVGAPHERSSYRAFCRKYPRPVLEDALARVAAAGRIRKSRGALFTYLVKKLA